MYIFHRPPASGTIPPPELLCLLHEYMWHDTWLLLLMTAAGIVVGSTLGGILLVGAVVVIAIFIQRWAILMLDFRFPYEDIIRFMAIPSTCNFNVSSSPVWSYATHHYLASMLLQGLQHPRHIPVATTQCHALPWIATRSLLDVSGRCIQGVWFYRPMYITQCNLTRLWRKFPWPTTCGTNKFVLLPLKLPIISYSVLTNSPFLNFVTNQHILIYIVYT